jgi:uncharacterized protein (DUF1800 family)
MLHYLDQWQSVADGSRAPDGKTRGLNENYARELMELHTLGVHGGYSQKDVRELARILTGWTIGPQADSGFRFAARMHDNGSKTLLGQRYGGIGFGGGEQEGVDAIRALARHPSTAQRVCLRLAQFVSDPPSDMVNALIQTFHTQGCCRRVVKRCLPGRRTNGSRRPWIVFSALAVTQGASWLVTERGVPARCWTLLHGL